MSTLLAVYDLQSSPPTFDVVAFLVAAERERILRGMQDIRIVIAPGPDNGFRRDNLPPRDPKARRRMLENIVFKMSKLLPSCVSLEEGLPETADFPRGWSKYARLNHYGMHHIASAWKAGMYPLRATKRIEGRRLVTFSPRQAHYWPTRNINAKAWRRLGLELVERGYRVGVIPDVDGDFYHPEFEMFEQASTDAEERAAVYESATLNLFTGQGPMAMASFMGKANCLVFKMLAEGAVCTDERFFKGAGFPVGSQIGRTNHRIVWQSDEENVLLDETLSELAEESCLPL